MSEVPFSVGDVESTAGKNMGSAKIFSFATLSKLEKEATLHCASSSRLPLAPRLPDCAASRRDWAAVFGDYYRLDVLENPDGTDHANIRAFMKGGWPCVNFPEGLAIKPKGSLS